MFSENHPSLKTLKLVANNKTTVASQCRCASEVHRLTMRAGEALSHILDPANPNRNKKITKLTFEFNMQQYKDRYADGRQAPVACR